MRRYRGPRPWYRQLARVEVGMPSWSARSEAVSSGSRAVVGCMPDYADEPPKSRGEPRVRAVPDAEREPGQVSRGKPASVCAPDRGAFDDGEWCRTVGLQDVVS